MNHIDEKILELFVLDAEEVRGERAGIERHLLECAGCADLAKEMRGFYDEVSELRNKRPEQETRALTVRNMMIRPPSRDAVAWDQVPKTMPARAVLFVLRHPVLSSVSFAAVVVAALLLVLLPQRHTQDLNPSYARPKDEFLVAYNNQGEEVWRKHVGNGFDLYVAKWPLNRRAIFTADANHDGRNEVYCIYGDIPNLPFHSSIVSYDWDGRERWRYEFHKDVRFGKEQITDDYEFNSMLVGDFYHDGNVEIFAELEHHERYPNVVIRLDAKTGALTGEFLHAGNIEYMTHKDFEKTGVDEIFLTNTSVFDGRVPLVVFDPRAVDGCAPVPAGMEPAGIPPGTEKYYILFPRTGLEKTRNFLSTAGETMYFKPNGLLEVITYDRFKDGSAFAVMYYFDSTMRCTNVLASEPNLTYYRKLQQEELTIRKIDQQFLDDLRKGVQYWDGEKFVSRPAVNKRYLAARRQPS